MRGALLLLSLSLLLWARLNPTSVCSLAYGKDAACTTPVSKDRAARSKRRGGGRLAGYIGGTVISGTCFFTVWRVAMLPALSYTMELQQHQPVVDVCLQKKPSSYLRLFYQCGCFLPEPELAV